MTIQQTRFKSPVASSNVNPPNVESMICVVLYSKKFQIKLHRPNTKHKRAVHNKLKYPCLSIYLPCEAQRDSIFSKVE